MFYKCLPDSKCFCVFIVFLTNAWAHLNLIIASIEFCFLSCLNALFLAFTAALQSSFHRGTFFIRIIPVVLGIISSAD